MENVRQPSAAGRFYPADPARLKGIIEECYRHPIGPGKLPAGIEKSSTGITGFMAPHAGLGCSGPVAAHAYFRVAALGQPSVVVILGPDHYGLGAGLTISPWAWWETPLGRVNVDIELGEKLFGKVPGIIKGYAAHSKEHSIEMQVLFLSHLFGDRVPVLPISMTDQSLEQTGILGETLASLLEGRNAVVVASSDLSHYLPDRQARIFDEETIKAIATLEPEAVAELYEQRWNSLCSPGPVMALLATMQSVGVPDARVLAYCTSADTCSDTGKVVGYAAIEMGEYLDGDPDEESHVL